MFYKLGETFLFSENSGVGLYEAAQDEAVRCRLPSYPHCGGKNTDFCEIHGICVLQKRIFSDRPLYIVTLQRKFPIGDTSATTLFRNYGARRAQKPSLLGLY